MKKQGKKILAFLCVCTLLMNYLPVSMESSLFAKAAETDSDLSANVTVTIAKNGTFAVSDFQHTTMAQVPIEVTDADNDNALTFNDAMLLIHEKYCKDGYAASAGQYGFSVNKLWNDESGAFGYKINGNSAFSAKEPIADNDEICAWIYKDQTSWSDTFSNFAQGNITAEKNSKVALQLFYDSYDSSWNIVKNNFADATITVLENGQFVPLQQNDAVVKANEEGKAEISFKYPGKYVISATTDSETPLVPPACVITVTDQTYQTAYQKAISYLKETANDEDTFAKYGNEWNIMALARSGNMTESIKKKYVESVCNALKEKEGILSESRYTEYSRVIIALSSLGIDATDVGGYNLVQKLADYETVTKQGLNGAVYALIALDTRNYNCEIAENDEVSDIRNYYVNIILDKQLADHGWTFYGDTMDVDMTSMALQALQPYAQTNEQVAVAADNAFTALSEKQNDAGAFESYGAASPESMAQVICALTAWDRDCYSSAFIKSELSVIDALLAFQCEDGSFAHSISQDGTLTSNAMATCQAVYSLVAYERWKNGETTLYDMTDVSVQEPEQETTTESATTTSAPATTTEPATTTSAPATTTEPATTTSAPATTTQAPAVTTSAPATTTQNAAKATSQTAPTLKAQKITKVKSGKGKCQITFLKMSKISGYELQYATKKTFTKKTTKTLQLKKNTKVVKKLKKGKTYYFRVRAYKVVNKKTYYGAYSKVKTVKIKK